MLVIATAIPVLLVVWFEGGDYFGRDPIEFNCSSVRPIKRGASVFRSGLGLFSLVLCLALSAFYLVGWVPSIFVTSIFLSCHFLAAFAWGPEGRGGLLARLYLLVYIMPYVHIFEYIGFSFNPNTPIIVGGLLANPYTLDQQVMTKTFAIGLIGLQALSAGVFFVSESRHDNQSKQATLAMLPFSVLIISSLFFSWLYAPIDTIFQTRYTESLNILQSWKVSFNASWLLSYTLAIVALCDLLMDQDLNRKRLKIAILAPAFLIIIVYFQFLRGDRECMGLVVSVAILSLSPFLKSKLVFSSRNIFIVFLALLLSVVFFMSAQYVGAVRSIASSDSRVELEDPGVSVVGGTWSASLLSTVSVVGDIHYERMDYEWGQTYLDYFLSLPPSFLAQKIGYVRPIDTKEGNVAWKMRYGIGGNQVVVVPFMNFGPIGVVSIFLLIGFMLGKIEANSSHKKSVRTMFYVGVMGIIAPHWFWYGDLALIRGIMSGFVVLVFYEFFILFSTPLFSRRRLRHLLSSA